MKILIAVKSCQLDMNRGCHEAIRRTWGNNLPEGVDVRFFIGGNDTSIQSDEVHLSVDDSYWELTPKTKGIAAYTIRNDYNFVYYCDTDTYLIIPKLLDSSFKNFDFSGGHLCSTSPEQVFGQAYGPLRTERGGLISRTYVYLSGGVGFFVSNKAAHALANTLYHFHSEDVWVGQVLGPFIASGELRAGLLHGIEGHCAWHLNCGYYGGGNRERLSPMDAITRKHGELNR